MTGDRCSDNFPYKCIERLEGDGIPNHSGFYFGMQASGFDRPETLRLRKVGVLMSWGL